MKKIILTVFICIILESVVISYPITLLAITLLSIFIEEDVVLLAFITGIVLDLFSLRTIGVSSLYFLALIYMGNRYRKKIYGGAFVYRFSYLFLSYLVYNFLFYKTVSIYGVITAAIFGAAALLFLDRLYGGNGNKRRLSV